MSNYSILFPGQGSQSIGMMDTFAEIDIVRQTFAEASKILEKNLWGMISIENTDIHKTENTQPIMLTAGIAIWRLLREKSQINPSFLAGHSLGEFTALVAADAIDFNEALKLVTKRAELMQEAVPEGFGAMAAIIGLDDEKVIELCRNNKSSEVIDPVNFNSPGQVVIAGHKSILENSLEDFKEAGAKRAILLPVSVPSHCSLMRDAAEEFSNYLSGIKFKIPKYSIIHNIDCKSYTNSNQIKEALVKQLYNPVQWTSSIRYMIKHKVNFFIEAGPGKVLSGLNKRISKDSENHSTETLDKLRKTIEVIEG